MGHYSAGPLGMLRESITYADEAAEGAAGLELA
jgi:hypothetical protein